MVLNVNNSCIYLLLVLSHNPSGLFDQMQQWNTYMTSSRLSVSSTRTAVVFHDAWLHVASAAAVIPPSVLYLILLNSLWTRPGQRNHWIHLSAVPRSSHRMKMLPTTKWLLMQRKVNHENGNALCSLFVSLPAHPAGPEINRPDLDVSTAVKEHTTTVQSQTAVEFGILMTL